MKTPEQLIYIAIEELSKHDIEKSKYILEEYKKFEKALRESDLDF